MRATRSALAAAAAFLVAATAVPASATVTYSGGALGNVGYDPTYFSLTVPDFINVDTTISAAGLSSCFGIAGLPNSITPLSCSSVSFFTTGPTDLSSYLLVNFSGGGSQQFNFSGIAGPFSQDGSYSSSSPAYANANLGFLNVSGSPSVSAVPEPATWATLLFGFGLLGAAMRRHRREGERVRLA